MLEAYLNNSSNHEYKILITYSHHKHGVWELFYCIRKHSDFDLYSLKTITIIGDKIDISYTNDFSTYSDVKSSVDDYINMLSNYTIFGLAAANQLMTCAGILYVTKDLSILYADSDGNLKTSTRIGNTFDLPGYIVTDYILSIFKKMGCIINV